MDTLRLQQEFLRMQRRGDRLAALLRLVIVVLKLSGVSLSNIRIPEGGAKLTLLRTIERSCCALPLKVALRVIRLSHSRYHAWKQEEGLLGDKPALLTDGGVENHHSAVDELIKTGLLKRLLAVTEITYSNSMIESWWRALKHQWLYLNTLDTVSTLERLVTFYLEEHNTRLPHSAFRGQTADEMSFGTGNDIPAELEAARISARKSRIEANRNMSCKTCEPLTSIAG